MPMTMSKASVSNTLQCWVTVSSPRQKVTSTPPKEWMVRASPTVMATVLVSLKVFSRCRAIMESVAPVSSTAQITRSPIFKRIQKTKSSSSEPPPYSSAGNFTSTPAAIRDWANRASRVFLELDPSGETLSPCWRFLGSTSGKEKIAGADERLQGMGVPPLQPPLPPPLAPLSPLWGFLEGVQAFWRSASCRLCWVSVTFIM